MTKNKKQTSKYLLGIAKEYSLYVATSRAIPSVCDGLKTSQRIALYLMRNKQDKIKVVSLSGEMISSNLYVHGDQSASAAISLLAAPYCNNRPLFDGVGNFGTRIFTTEFASPRYVYVKKNKFSDKVLYADTNIIPMKENYDGSAKEPVNFLPLIPTVLLNGITGIAVGWSTDILPRSFSDLVNATINVLDGKKLKQIEPKYEYLDINTKNIDVNTWEFSGKINILDTSTVEITELPPDLSLDKFKERLNSYEDDDKIQSYEDNSRDKISVKVKFKRGSIKDYTEEKLIDFFKLKTKKIERIVVIDWNNNAIRQYENAEKLVYDFVDWRLNYYKKRYEVFVEETKDDISYYSAILNCFKHKLHEKVGKLKNKKELMEEIKKINPDIKEEYIDKISLLPTYNWTIEYLQSIKEKIQTCNDKLKEYTSILNDDSKLKDVYRSELLELKKAIK